MQNLDNYLKDQFQDEENVKEYIHAALEQYFEDHNKELFLASLKEVKFNIVNKNESDALNQEEDLNDFSDDDFCDEDDEYYSDVDEDGKNFSQTKGPNSQVLSFS